MQTYGRKVKDGFEYDSLFPKAFGNETIIKKDADLKDTLKFIPEVVRKTRWHTKKIAPLLEGKSLMETLRNVFDFTYDHISYKKDDEGLEQIRSPGRAWRDRKRGIDCDCYSVFISSILINLGIPVTLRVAKYKEENGFQHIYPIVPLPGGKYVTMDPVVHVFNHEQKPILEKIDKNMNLNYLDGIDDDDYGEEYFDNDEPIYGLDGELGKGISIKKIGQGIKKAASAVKTAAKKISIKNVLNVVNKINPATVLLRNGVLAGMKLNIMRVAGNLRWAYLSDAQAQQKGILMDRLVKLRAVRKKLEDIFFGAGGKVDNLKNAILTGKGNQGREVPLSGLEGLGYLDDYALSGMDESTPLNSLLGEVYYSENEELGELGEPVTAAALAAASGALASIAAIIKGIGSVFQKGKAPANEAGQEGGANEPVNISQDGSVESSSSPLPTLAPLVNKLSPLVNKLSPFAKKLSPFAKTAATSVVQKAIPILNPGRSASTLIPMEESADDGSPPPSSSPSAVATQTNSYLPAAATSAELAPASADPSTSATDGFWAKNKKWALPAAIGVGVVAAALIGMKAMKNKPAAKLSGLSGVRRKRKSKSTARPRKIGRPKTKTRASTRKRKLTPVAIM